MKYTNSMVTFSEIPNEISLCVNISGCPIHCEGCHSKYLWEDIGKPLTIKAINTLIKKNEGITCLCLMGGDQDEKKIVEICKHIKSNYFLDNNPSDLKTAWYSGKHNFSPLIQANLQYFDYIKLGPYVETLGPLTSKFRLSIKKALRNIIIKKKVLSLRPIKGTC